MSNMSKKNNKVLIIDDDSILRKTLRDFLLSENFQVEIASDGEFGIEAVKSCQPDIIILDIILPKKNGFEVLEEIKSRPDTKSIPVILLTNLGSASDIEKAVKMGVTTYLVKTDYSMEDVLKKIRETLSC